jgi:hypothetical protein
LGWLIATLEVAAPDVTELPRLRGAVQQVPDRRAAPAQIAKQRALSHVLKAVRDAVQRDARFCPRQPHPDQHEAVAVDPA